MISIKVEENIEIDDDLNEFKSYHKNQLLYLNFQIISNTYNYSGDRLQETVLKLNEYLISESMSFSANNKFTFIIATHESELEKFNSLRIQALNYKNSSFDNLDFKKFNSFCNKKINRKLKQHQIKAAYHLFMLKGSANFSVPGSGKTSTVLVAYEKMRLENYANCLIVVGPPSSFSSWKNEFEYTLGRKANLTILSGESKTLRTNQYFDVNQSDRVLLLSFQTFTNDLKLIIKYLKHPNTKAFLVIDEAHYIKQLDGIWANALLKSSDYSVARCVLTGTPCPRSYSDLFNLFDFIWGKNVVMSSKDKASILYYEKRNELNLAGQVIKTNIDPFFYRVRKKELGLTEPIFNAPINITMNKNERLIYDSIYKKIAKLSILDNASNIDLLLKLKSARIIRLRQALSNVNLLKSKNVINEEEELFDESSLKSILENYYKIETPAKIDALDSLVNKIQMSNRKILIWSNFLGTIEMLRKHFVKHGLAVQTITGETPVVNQKNSEILTREKIIDQFLDLESDKDILIANPGACAESISLHKSCHNAIYYDLSYNCSQYLQSLDRIHRVGGSENVVSNYYFLQYSDTIESDIYSNLIKKRDKMYNVIEYDSDIYSLDIDVFEDSDAEVNAYDRIFKNDLR